MCLSLLTYLRKILAISCGFVRFSSSSGRSFLKCDITTVIDTALKYESCRRLYRHPRLLFMEVEDGFYIAEQYLLFAVKFSGVNEQVQLSH